MDEIEQHLLEKNDEELVEILTTKKSEYRTEAVQIAQSIIDSRGISDATFERYKEALVQAVKQQEIIRNAEAPALTRAIHFVVDTSAMVAIFIGINYMLNNLEVISIQLGIYVYFGYYLAFESTIGATIGKLLTGSKVILQNGQKPDVFAIINRTLCRLIPFDPPSFIFRNTGMRLHDSWSGTTVVNKKFG